VGNVGASQTSSAPPNDQGEPAGRLVHRLDLDMIERSETEAGAAILWRGVAGENATNLAGRLFGGMVIAQSIVAAARVNPTRHLHSLQQVFLRGGQTDAPIDYYAETLFTGRTYQSVRVEVRQKGEVIAHAQAGLSSGIEGPDRQLPSPATSAFDDTIDRGELRQRCGWQDAPIAVRVEQSREEGSEPNLDTWLKPNGALPADPIMHQAMLSYVSDRAFMSTAWKPHRASHGTFQGSTLDHTIWFHRPVTFDDWHVFAMHSPVITNGRGLNHGVIHHRDGTHVASVAQQGTFRPKPNQPHGT